MSQNFTVITDTFIPKNEVRKVIGEPSDTTLWRMWSKGDFPKPITISANRKVWLKSEIEAWMTSRVAMRISSETNRPRVEVVHAR
jgi:predicted DNA-binding transcriptional regulator AlpA